MSWSITVTNNDTVINNDKVKAAIASIPDNEWVDIDYTVSGDAQVGETTYQGGRCLRDASRGHEKWDGEGPDPDRPRGV